MDDKIEPENKEYSLPCRLGKAYDDIGLGAIIKNLSSEDLSVVVGRNAPGGRLVVCGRGRSNTEGPCSIKDFFKIDQVEHDIEWIVLSLGDPNIEGLSS